MEVFVESQSETFLRRFGSQGLLRSSTARELRLPRHLFQYALSTRVGCECIAHTIQTLTGIDEEAHSGVY